MTEKYILINRETTVDIIIIFTMDSAYEMYLGSHIISDIVYLIITNNKVFLEFEDEKN